MIQFIEPNDRIVFFGDSITGRNHYTSYIETWLITRYPEYNLTFFNVGWGGDDAGGGLERLDRDVLFSRPTKVILSFGMNDGRYTSLTKQIKLRYRQKMTELIERLMQANIGILLCTVGMADERIREDFKTCAYNKDTLRALAQIVRQLGKLYSLPVADLYSLMNKVTNKFIENEPEKGLTHDGFHPNTAGHVVMGLGVLHSIGFNPQQRMIKAQLKNTKNQIKNGLAENN